MDEEMELELQGLQDFDEFWEQCWKEVALLSKTNDSDE